MKRFAFGLLALAGSTSLIAGTASAQTVCGERANFLTHLGKNYSEAPVGMGLTSSGQIIEVLTSDKGSWTIIVTHPNGQSCLIAAGEDWESLKRVAMDPGA